ncbi:MAG: PEP-CTERM sorting domain-containing protein [Wenzhouxiangellaceae bacterium]
MKTIKSYLGAFAAVSLLFMAGAVSAAPISGDVTFTGSWEAKAADKTTNVGIRDAVHIKFLFAEVDAALGDFAGSDGSVASFTDFTFDPFEGPVTPLWTIEVGGTTFSFELENVGLGLQTDTLLVLAGTGTVTASGPGSAAFDATEFMWEFSGNSTRTILSFSAISMNVPEPSVVGLLGLGLIGMGAVGMRRRKAARQA